MSVTDAKDWDTGEWGGRGVADILADEHERIDRLLSDVVAMDAAKQGRRDVADAFISSLTRHLSAEEQDLLPATRKAAPDLESTIDAELAADVELLHTLAALHKADATSEEFDALLARTQLQVRRHISAAHEDIHPEVRRRMTREEQVRLGNRVDIFAEAAPTRPHPKTPMTPPLNKIVDPAMGAVDKIRDVLSGRKTRPQDL
ncbi:hemerythrin domain-containing protein [Hamadaea tsunoensis]|uniref:hemerythrin domain-containing protein n=1 Tax=Hamadaea tsunoensis TaxID=53368 RepID=UPI0004821776|nr:hemerythrin domain-containing protein [Hamadaea tsunoensis]